jgi:NSS family neurotransmitter:Na+ symporter
MSRHRAVVLATAISWALGICALLSFNAWKDVHPLGWIDYFAGKTFFDLFDFFAANILLPVGGVLVSIYAGWVLHRQTMAAEIGGGLATPGFRAWHVLIRYVAPVAVLTVLVYTLMG